MSDTSSFQFGNAVGEQAAVINATEAYSTPSDAPGFDWSGFLGELVSITPGVINAVNGTSPDNITYVMATEDEGDDSMIYIILGVVVLVAIVLFLTLKK